MPATKELNEVLEKSRRYTIMLPQPIHGSARLNLHMCTPQVDGGASRDALAEKYGNAPSEAAIRSMLSNEPCKQHVTELEVCMHDAHLLACLNAACMASMSHVIMRHA